MTDKTNASTIDEIRADSSLCCESLNTKSNSQNEIKVVEDLDLFRSQYEGKY